MQTTIASANPVHSARDRILDAAVELFATRGFQAVGLRDLASNLGLHAGSLYHHIDNKQALLFELIESGLLDLLQETKRRMKCARRPCERLNLFIQAFVKFNFNEKYKLALITSEFANLNKEQQTRIIQLKNRYLSLLSTVIANEYDEKEKLSGDICPLTNTVVIILFGQSQWYSSETTEQELTATLTNIITHITANYRSH
ncbi:TetR/AcrR family transcriptional regulator [Pseudomonas sp. FW305-70]|uniref:TetR/AcrR family transcriptional regulator n=1 Tax=Pseudomonas sp. FW305-70 TaxID=2751342 RepID=UPI000C887DE9|nr:TetR/AcrR family transcriptional regulator [Pseudomonas sp. FW305-70]PMZ74309.1 TetR/AcrR family transcriptional regulator [Pseudomonas sp. FW305-70]